MYVRDMIHASIKDIGAGISRSAIQKGQVSKFRCVDLDLELGRGRVLGRVLGLKLGLHRKRNRR